MEHNLIALNFSNEKLGRTNFGLQYHSVIVPEPMVAQMKKIMTFCGYSLETEAPATGISQDQ